MLNLLFLFFTFQIWSAPYEVNKDHSQIRFKVPYMTLSEVQGSFGEFNGSIDFDPKNLILKKITSQILASSVDTHDKKRDSHLRKNDFFYIQKYPQISFESKKVLKKSKNKFEATGTLEITGIKRNIKLDIDYLGQKKDHVQKQSVFFKATTKINRRDFGIIWNKSLDNNEYLLGDIIEIEIIIQAQPQGRKTPFSAHLIPSNETLEKYAKLKRSQTANSTTAIKIQGTKRVKALPVSTSKKVIADMKQNDSLPWGKLFSGFIGFCALIGFSYFIKLKMIHLFKEKYHSETSLYSLLGDFIVIILTLAYTVWFFRLLY